MDLFTFMKQNLNRPIDIYETMQRTTIEILGLLAFGYQFGVRLFVFYGYSYFIIFIFIIFIDHSNYALVFTIRGNSSSYRNLQIHFRNR